MNRKLLFIIAILIVIVILMGIILWKGIKHTPQTITSKQSTHLRAPLPKEATITLDKNGFSPDTVTIKVGSAVIWKNESGSEQTVNSDNYPTNQLHKELNFGLFSNGSSVTYTFTKVGTYGFHNQFNHTQTGKIIVIK